MNLKITGLAIAVVLVALYGLFLFHKIDLTSADLGRHIKNGEMVWQHPEVLRANFYSSTYPDYPAINHHWGAGVIFWTLWKMGGIAAIQLLFIILSLGALLLFYLASARRAGVGLAGLVSLAALPIILVRGEIRPEVFSYFFAGLFFYLLSERRWPWVLPVVQIFWVNVHIYFFLGPVLILFFLLESLRVDGFTSHGTKRLSMIFILTSAASLLNPFGLRGALAPFNIFNAYGYKVLENAPVWFLETLFDDPVYTLFKIAAVILLLSFVLVAIKNRRLPLPETLLAVMLTVMAWTALRNFAIFGFFLIPLLAGNTRALLGNSLFNSRKTGLAVAVLGLVLLMQFGSGRELGLGSVPGNDAAAVFFKENNLREPIFNNYDIGGYLIYHLFPAEKVFVDNRPEAYPPEFFQNEYIPMQQNEAVWQKQAEKYGFRSIVFSHNDLTPWAQTFLAARAKDPLWRQAFRDERVVIFQKNP